MTGTFALIDNAGFIYGSYAITLIVIGLFAWRIIRRGRQLSARVSDDEKYWT